MKPSWVRTHGLISRLYHIVWIRAPRYRRLSSSRSRIRENSVSKFWLNLVTNCGGIFDPVVFSATLPTKNFVFCLPARPPGPGPGPEPVLLTTACFTQHDPATPWKIYTKCIQQIYNICIQNVYKYIQAIYKIYSKYMQNIYKLYTRIFNG